MNRLFLRSLVYTIGALVLVICHIETRPAGQVAHYKIDWNGSFTEVDQALPVLSSYQPSPIALEKLKQPTWSKLDNHLSAFAYLSDSPLYY